MWTLKARINAWSYGVLSCFLPPRGFQNRLPGATGVLPRFGSFRSQFGCAFESTILPPCVRELMWLVRMGAIWIDMGSVACVFFKTPRWSGWRDRKDHDDVMDSDFSKFPKKMEEWSNLKDTYIQDAKSFLWDLRSRIGCSKVLCEIHQFMMEYPNFYELGRFWWIINDRFWWVTAEV